MIVRNSKFVSDPFGDGGSKRSTQIEELLKENGCEYVNDPFALPKGLPFVDLFKLSVRAFDFIRKNVGWKNYSGIRSKIHAIKYFALRLPVIFDKYSGKDVTFIWENTASGNYGYPYLMKAAGAKVIAFPHNLESLVPTQSDIQTGKVAPNWLADEIERLKLCDKVFTISREECWLLRQHGIDAAYLPYYPPREAERFLLGIRAKRVVRKPNDRTKFLLLGSATNPPTRKGMQELLDETAKLNLCFDVYVAGHQTESLSVPSHLSIHPLGTLGKEDLERLLVCVDAVLICQPPTSGALTRIPEMLVAGIPVFANFNAARSFHDTCDVTVYQTFDELFSCLTAFRPHVAADIGRQKLAKILDP